MHYEFPTEVNPPSTHWLSALAVRGLWYVRTLVLRRDWAEIESEIERLDGAARKELLDLIMKEIGAAARAPVPHWYGGEPPRGSEPWGQGCDIARRRFRSGNPILKLRGIALWIAVAYHETQDAQQEGLRRVHVQILRGLRSLKETPSQASEDDVLKRYGLEIRA